MLRALGVASTDALFDVIPRTLRYPEIDIGRELTELEATHTLETLSNANRAPSGMPFFLGGGAYRHFVPAAVSALMSRGEFATSYTPYQPEVSQGTLQAMFEFQSMICALTGLDVSNSSVYDGASAVAEAALMAMRSTGRNRIAVSGAVHPHYREVLRSYVQAREAEIVTTDMGLGPNPSGSQLRSPSGSRLSLVEEDVSGKIDAETACCIVSQPTFFGEIRDLLSVVTAAHERGALVIEVYNPTSLGLLRSPGAWGADIAVGEGQPLGLSLSYGGPYVGLMSCRQDLVRQMPGRIVGAATDAQGRPGYLLTLQAREQHIRREKATSNICTSQTLMALGATIYLALLGPQGLRSVAESCRQMANYAADQLADVPGVEIVTPSPFFHEFAIRTPIPAVELSRCLLVERDIIGGPDLGQWQPALDHCMLLCCTEMTRQADVDALVMAMGDILGSSR